MRSALLFLGSLGVLGVTACSDRYYDDEGSAIIFGISQHADATTGALATEASYEFLELANQNGGWTTSFLHDDRDDTTGSCWFERFDARLGLLRVLAAGPARPREAPLELVERDRARTRDAQYAIVGHVIEA